MVEFFFAFRLDVDRVAARARQHHRDSQDQYGNHNIGKDERHLRKNLVSSWSYFPNRLARGSAMFSALRSSSRPPNDPGSYCHKATFHMASAKTKLTGPTMAKISAYPAPPYLSSRAILAMLIARKVAKPSINPETFLPKGRRYKLAAPSRTTIRTALVKDDLFTNSSIAAFEDCACRSGGAM